MDRRIKIRLVTAGLPDDINAMCSCEGVDDYIVMLNDNMTEQEKAAKFLHECLHIYHRDHEGGKQVNQLEADRHEELLQLLQAMTAKAG